MDVARGRCASIGWIVTRLFDGLSDCVCYASERMILLLFLSYELGLIVRSAGSVASVFIDGVLHRETIVKLVFGITN